MEEIAIRATAIVEKKNISKTNKKNLRLALTDGIAIAKQSGCNHEREKHEQEQQKMFEIGIKQCNRNCDVEES